MACQDACHGIQKACAVSGRNGQQPALALVVGPQQHARSDRKALDAARNAALHRLGQRLGFGQCAAQLALHQIDQLTVALRCIGGNHLEGVERIAVERRVHPGVQDREAGAVEIAADAGKQVGLVGRIHHDLQTFASERLAGAHDGRAASHMAREMAGVPGNVGCLLPHEVIHPQGVPQGLVRLVRLGREREHHQGFALADFGLRRQIRRSPAQHAQGGAVQVFQQLALPAVPHLGAGAADIGHGQQVEGREVAFVVHALGKGGNHLGIGRILLLRHLAHGEVLAHQKFHQQGVFPGDPVVAAEALDFGGANFRMVAAAPFADVVKECCQIQNPWLVPARSQL
ncbi:hypothetical protein D3C72_1212570 [compost metagenome]